MSRFKTSLAVFVAGICIAFGFQNCGRGFETHGSSYSGSSGAPSEPCVTDCTPQQPAVTPDKFQAGEAFNTASLPYVAQGTLVAELPGYAALTGYKALAMAANGFGFIANHAQMTSQAEASRAALEACQVVSNDQPCAVLAEANVFKYSETAFKAAMAKVLETGVRTYNVATVPFQRDVIKANQLGGYLTNGTPVFRALAIDLKGGGSIGWSDLSQADANRLSREKCEGFSRGRPCTVYAEGANVLFNVSVMNFNFTPAIDYSRTVFTASAVPFVTAAARTALANYPSYANANAQAALAIHPNGAYAYDNSPATALASCRAFANNVSDCIIYANGINVTFSLARLQQQF